MMVAIPGSRQERPDADSDPEQRHPDAGFITGGDFLMVGGVAASYEFAELGK